MKKNHLLPLIPACLVLTAAGTEIEDDLHECTSWIVMPELTGGKSMMIHKNRDASSDRLQLYKGAEPGKNSWISISNLNSKMAYAGLNDKGLAVAMNSGDPTEFYSDKAGFYTPEICRSALENCATADAAVEHIRQLIKARNYQHKKSGSMWFIGDGKKAYIIENDAVHFAAHEVKANFAIRANAWHYPEMIIYSKRTPAQLTNHHRREFAVRQALFADGTKYAEPVTVEKISFASRINEFPEDPKCYPLCGKRTDSGTTIVIDCEYPAELSTMFAAFGPPRHTVYLPVPFLCTEFPAELTSGKFCDAVFARFRANRELLPQDKLAEFERTLNRRHDAAVEKARAILKKGGSKAEAGKILTEAFLQNWEDVRKLSEGK